MDSNKTDGMVFNQPVTFDERKRLAGILVDKLKYRIPVAVDDVGNAAETAYAAWPERIYVIGRGGRILYRGGMGPFEFHPEEAEEVLRNLPR